MVYVDIEIGGGREIFNVKVDRAIILTRIGVTSTRILEYDYAFRTVTN